MAKLVMYTGGLGPYCECNNRQFPEKVVVEIDDSEWPALKFRRKFIEVKGIQLNKNSVHSKAFAPLIKSEIESQKILEDLKKEGKIDG